MVRHPPSARTARETMNLAPSTSVGSERGDAGLGDAQPSVGVSFPTKGRPHVSATDEDSPTAR